MFDSLISNCVIDTVYVSATKLPSSGVYNMCDINGNKMKKYDAVYNFILNL